MQFRLLSLGKVGLVDAGGAPVDFPLGKPFGILAYLALSTDPVPRDELAALFWNGGDRSRARHSLRQALSFLRQRLGDDIFATDDPVTLEPVVLETDVGLLEEALRGGDVDRILELYQGPFLETFQLSASPGWAHWVEAQRRVLEERVAAALRDAAERTPARAVELLRRVVEIEPHRIRHRRALVERLLGRGEVDEATAVVAETRQAGLADGDTVAELEARVRAVREGRRAAAERSERHLEFVGRTAELASLTGAWREAVAGRHQIAVVSGPTGIGKTRLAEELALVAGARGRVVHVKASAVERRLEGSVTAELARALYRLPGGAGVGAAAMNVLRSLVPSLGGPGGVASPAMPPPPPVAVSDALVDLASAVAYESPLLIVLDDVQWVDRSSLTLLLRMTRHLRGEPVMALFTYRSEELGSRQQAAVQALVEEENGTTIRLNTLRRTEVQEMLLLDLDEPAERIERLSGRLHDVTRGHPLFLVELLRSLRDDGVLVPAGGGWRFREPGPVRLELPASVRTVIDRRLDRLSDDARRLGAELAALPPSAGLERIRARTGLSDAAFTAALNELADRAVVTWDPAGRLAFTHDQLREAMAAGSPRQRRWRTAAVLAAVAAGLLAVLVLARTDPPARWGGGTIVVPDGDTPVALDAGLPPGRWEPNPGSIWRPAGAGAIRRLTPSRLADGRLVWTGSIPGTVEAPEGVIYWGRDDRQVRHWPGDDNVQDVSPDGRRIAWVTQHYGGDGYAKELRLARPDEEIGTVVAGPASFFRSAWSADGTRLAVAVTLERDSLLILTPGGDRLRGWSFYQVILEDWCGPDQVLAVVRRSPASERTRLLLEVETGTEFVLDHDALPGARCSPDGTAYVARIAGTDAIRMLVTDIASGDRHVLPDPLGAGLSVHWIPDQVPPVPVALEAEQDTVRLEQGGTTVLGSRLRLSNREHRPIAVPWRSLDPAVASVRSGTTVAANRPGQALLVGEYGGWWADTVIVDVREGNGESLILADDFRSLAPADWFTIGHPAPEIVRVGGRDVLELRGDGRYTDGVVSRTARAAPAGFTVELEFRIPITAREYQSFGLQVGNYEPPESAEDRDHLSAWHVGDAVLMAIPAFELDKWDPRLVGFRTRSRLEALARLPEGSSTAEWTHVAFQVQTDGMASLWIDRERVARLHVPTDFLRRPLRVAILADAYDTHAYVRNLVWWSEPRFPGGRSPGPGD